MNLKDQVAQAIWQGFYEVVNVTVNLPQDQFFKSTIISIWPKTRPPSDWPTFWYDAVALEIQSNFVHMGMYLPKFNSTWLQNSTQKNTQTTWNDLLTMATTVSAGNPGLIPYNQSI